MTLWNEDQGDDHELTGNKSQEHPEGLIHETIRMKADPKHVDTEPGETVMIFPNTLIMAILVGGLLRVGKAVSLRTPERPCDLIWIAFRRHIRNPSVPDCLRG